MAKPWTWLRRTMNVARSGSYFGLKMQKAKAGNARGLTYSAIIFGTTLVAFAGQLVGSVSRRSRRGKKTARNASANRYRQPETNYREAYQKQQAEEYEDEAIEDVIDLGIGDVEISSQSLEDYERAKEDELEEDKPKKVEKVLITAPEGSWAHALWKSLENVDSGCVWVTGKELVELGIAGDTFRLTKEGEVFFGTDRMYHATDKVENMEQAMAEYATVRGTVEMSKVFLLIQLANWTQK